LGISETEKLKGAFCAALTIIFFILLVFVSPVGGVAGRFRLVGLLRLANLLR
jgi:hypothetical protein